MKYDLLVDNNALGEASSKSIKNANELNAIIKELQNDINEIDNAWKGPEVNNFKASIDKLANNLVDISNAYGEFGNVLSDLNSRYEQIDAECASELFKLENR